MKTALIAAAATAAVVISASFESVFAQQVTTRAVALSGRQVPGATPGVTYSYFDSFNPTGSNLYWPTVGDAGNVSFLAHLTGPGVTDANRQVVIAGPADAPRLVLRTGNPAPGFDAGATYFEFNGAPAINAAGQIAYRERVRTGAGATPQAIFAGPPAAPAVLVRQGDQAAGLPAGVTYATLGANGFNDAGQYAFTSTLAGSDVTTANNHAVHVTEQGAGTALVARTGDQAVGLPAGVHYATGQFGDFQVYGFNNRGQVAMSAFLEGPGVTARSNDLALYAGAPGALQVVARTGDPVPGAPAGVRYTDLLSSRLVLNDRGQVAFMAAVSGSPDRALFAGPADQPRMVARKGDLAPGAYAFESYTGLYRPFLNNTGRVVFGALAGGHGVLVTGAVNAPAVLFEEWQHAPGTPDGVEFAGFDVDGNAINDAGQIAFLAELSGAGVDVGNDSALYLYDPARGAQLVVREGSLFDVGGGDLRRVRDIRFFPGDGDSGLHGLGNDGQLLFGLKFTDSSMGMFIATVPEPAAGLALLTIGGAALATRRRPQPVTRP